MYPTKEQILSKRPKFRKGLILLTKMWKATSLKGWKTDEDWVKITKIGILIDTICALYRKKTPAIILEDEYCYNTRTHEIHLDQNNPSIISSLHELGHHLYGPSEYKACRWSVWLFMECFPGLYRNLKWDRHMLKK